MGMGKDILAYIKIKMIALALNEGWKPTFTEDEKRWYPYFKVSKNGSVSFTLAHYDASCAGTYFSSYLAFKSQELAEYAGKQFIDIYKDYLM